LGRGGNYLFKVVQLAIEAIAIDIAAAHVPEQDPGTLQALATGLETLPDAGTLAETVQQEKQFVVHHGRSQFENKSRAEALALMLRQQYSKAEAQAILHAAGDEAGLLRLIDALGMLLDELGGILMVAEDQLPSALAAFAERHRAANPMVA